MRKLYEEYKDLLSLDGFNIHNVIGLTAACMFGLAGFGVWLIVILINKHIKK